MRTVILVFLAALAVTGFSTPWVRQAAIALGFVDTPSRRKLHATPMPLMGGLAILVGSMLILLVYFGSRGNLRVLGALFAALLISLVGLIDDRRPLHPALKFSGQLVAFVIVVLLGTQVRLQLPEAINLLITFLWFGAITNAINFLDNMDGLCAGVAAIAAIFIALLASMSDQFLIAPIAAATFGACLGFLRYNFRPAQIFMGDAGSLLLGFLLAYMTLQLRFPNNSNFVTWMIPLFICGVPLFDLGLVTVSRLKRGVNPLTTAGKDHLSHRLVRRGFSQRETVLMIYLLGCACGLAALFVTTADLLEGYVMGATALALGAYGIYRLDRNGGPPLDK